MQTLRPHPRSAESGTPRVAHSNPCFCKPSRGLLDTFQTLVLGSHSLRIPFCLLSTVTGHSTRTLCCLNLAVPVQSVLLPIPSNIFQCFPVRKPAEGSQIQQRKVQISNHPPFETRALTSLPQEILFPDQSCDTFVPSWDVKCPFVLSSVCKSLIHRVEEQKGRQETFSVLLGK